MQAAVREAREEAFASGEITEKVGTVLDRRKQTATVWFRLRCADAPLLPSSETPEPEFDTEMGTGKPPKRARWLTQEGARKALQWRPLMRALLSEAPWKALCAAMTVSDSSSKALIIESTCSFENGKDDRVEMCLSLHCHSDMSRENVALELRGEKEFAFATVTVNLQSRMYTLTSHPADEFGNAPVEPGHVREEERKNDRRKDSRLFSSLILLPRTIRHSQIQKVLLRSDGFAVDAAVEPLLC